jgi:hypothetical protein
MMTTNPITPPPELVEKWVAEIWHEGTPVQVSASDIHIATQAAQWGADQELEACCKWLDRNTGRWDLLAELRAVRTASPSLKEQARVELDRLVALIPTEGALAVAEPIRRALEALDD